MTRIILATCLLGSVLGGCSMIKMNTGVKGVTNFNGKETRVEWKFKGTLDQLPAALAGAYGALAETRDKLIADFKKATELPKPGIVKLRHLSKSLKKYEKKSNLDFLHGGEVKQTGQRFTYVRLGAPQFDNFFRASMEFYALTWETQQASHRLREVAYGLLQEDFDTDGALIDLVARAADVKVIPSNKGLRKKFDRGRKLVGLLAELLPAFVEKTQQLVSTGQALVVQAPSALTNPKVVLHLDAVKQGLEESVTVVSESAGLLGDLTSMLAGF